MALHCPAHEPQRGMQTSLCSACWSQLLIVPVATSRLSVLLPGGGSNNKGNGNTTSRPWISAQAAVRVQEKVMACAQAAMLRLTPGWHSDACVHVSRSAGTAAAVTLQQDRRG
jgi:hypothetical protein